MQGAKKRKLKTGRNNPSPMIIAIEDSIGASDETGTPPHTSRILATGKRSDAGNERRTEGYAPSRGCGGGEGGYLREQERYARPAQPRVRGRRYGAAQRWRVRDLAGGERVASAPRGGGERRRPTRRGGRKEQVINGLMGRVAVLL
ncbi:Os02g0605550 [Oryza sativa Japonica Group]|uniref:Os02g0605550 protein n=2 Tax=Oryza sativa subsp. japonica TaxID=39947 RepID=Q6K8R5_ORYSJ|nr:hypothetical protein [Oryza sativa Japonica Group]BAS79657.1 Os02g0605550 [Oryza sativa Japonica Group]